MVQGWTQKMLTSRHCLMWDKDRVLLGWEKFQKLRHSALWFSQLLHGRVRFYWMASEFVGHRYNDVLCTKVHSSKSTNGAHFCVCKCIKWELSGYREKDGVQQKNTEFRGPGPRLEVPTSEQVTRAEAMDTRTEDWMLRLEAEGETQVVERAWPLSRQGDVQRVVVGNSLDRAGGQ